MQNVYVGRQPIYNRLLKLVGYELLFRPFESNSADVSDGDLATSQVILNAFMEIGLDELVGSHLAFINLTRRFITEEYPLPLAENRVVLEVLEDITVDDELVQSVRELAERGYQLALDDVVDLKDIRPLLEIAGIVKVDLMGMDKSDLPAMVRELKQYDLKLLAEKVETYDEFEMCKELGFHYYQGFFFSKPKVVTGRTIPESRLALLRLLSNLQKSAIEFSELEEIIRQDVSISYKLLKLINSSYYARPRKINSIRQALTLLGIRQIKDWVSLLALSKIEEKPRELMVTAMVRAKMTEILAVKKRIRDSESGFTVGLFSVLDALLDKPFDDILAELPLSESVSTALMERKGKLGRILSIVIAYEHGEWDEVDMEKLSPEIVRDSYLESVSWANAVSGLL